MRWAEAGHRIALLDEEIYGINPTPDYLKAVVHPHIPVLADLICANGPLAVEAILQSVQETAAMSEADALAREFEIGWPIFATADASSMTPQALAAYLAKYAD